MEKIDELFSLIKNNKYDEFKKKIENLDHFYLNNRNKSGNYLIIYAIVQNNIKILELLLEKKCNIDILTLEGRSILYNPIKYEYNSIVELLIKYNKYNIGIPIVDIKDKYDNTPLHYAIIFKNIKMVKLLLNNGAKTNNIDKNGNNALHLSVSSKDIDICKMIIRNGVNINAKTNNGETALHKAVLIENIDIVKLLVDKGIDVNIRGTEDNLSALIYAINIGNIKITKFLLLEKADPNLQDYYGRNTIHYAIIKELNEILYGMFILKNTIRPDVNIYDLNSLLPLHIVFYQNKLIDKQILEKILIGTNINYQDNIGNTVFHLICQKNIWKDFQHILESKKINIFIQNKNKKLPIDFINKNEIDDFLKMVTRSYLFRLRNYDYVWKEKWENICKKTVDLENIKGDDLEIIKKEISQIKNVNKDVCFDIIFNKLKKYNQNLSEKKDKQYPCARSFPIKMKSSCLKIIDDSDKEIELCLFHGYSIDILIGLIYLLQKHPNACAPISNQFVKNTQLMQFYETLNFKTNFRTLFLNFEVIWSYKRLFLSDGFEENYQKCIDNNNIRFIIVPLGIEVDGKNHANYLILDKNTYQLERFEPYGSKSPTDFNYNQKLLDNIISFKFSSINPNIEYISPEKYLPTISLQYFDVYEENTKKIADPMGFCALWSIWFTDMRIKYPDIPRNKLIKKIIKIIKLGGYSFKNIIRNYSKNIVEVRDKALDKAGLTINEWINDQYTQKQYDIVISELVSLINSSKKIE